MMTAGFTLHALAQTSAERLLNTLAEGLLIALFAWIVLRLIGRRNSGTRFAVWFCALLAIALSPFIQIGFTGSAGELAHSAAAFTMPSAWASYLFGAWAMIALMGLLRVAVGLWHLQRIRQSCTPVDAQDLDPMLCETLARFRSVRAVELRTSEELRVPTAIGFAEPAVVFPAWALRGLSVAELNTILLHELAHLRRWDDWTNLAQKVLRALFFFHPAVWFVENRLALEREMACDDIVLAHTSNPRAYAACLVSLAEKNLLHRGVLLAQAAVGRMRQTSARILQILDGRASHVVQVWKPAPWLVGVFSIACLASSAHAPKLVAFGDTRVVGQTSQPAKLSAAPPQLSAEQTGSVTQASYTERSSGAETVVRRKAKRAAAGRHRNPIRAPQSGFRVVRASAPVTSQPMAPQQAVFVIMEAQQYGDEGRVLWRVSVWRLSVGSEGSSRVVQEIFAKSI
jgi:beta-lactamase regulating signal transducer with metallopeptidase domain